MIKIPKLLRIIAILAIISSCQQQKISVKRKFLRSAAASNDDSQNLPPQTGSPLHSVWLRKDALKQSLSDSLGLSPDKLCLEFDGNDCFEDTHLVNLGGNNAETLGRTEGLSNPSLLTPVSMERIAIFTCKNLLVKELTSNIARVVFKNFNFESQTFNPKDISQALAKNLLARDLTDQEEKVFFDLSTGLDSKTYAELSCILMISSSNFIFQ